MMVFRRNGHPHALYTRDPNAPYMNESGKAACRLPSGHPEAFFEAFANVYRSAYDAMVAQKTGTKFQVAGARPRNFSVCFVDIQQKYNGGRARHMSAPPPRRLLSPLLAAHDHHRPCVARSPFAATSTDLRGLSPRHSRTLRCVMTNSVPRGLIQNNRQASPHSILGTPCVFNVLTPTSSRNRLDSSFRHWEKPPHRIRDHYGFAADHRIVA